ncbi:MAG: DNA phosphorothioation-associated putative methyltransferase [Brevundimonas aurantiaca]|uniref:DNA phosphorothioation-associated putative methyltransferase n=1 Tax=Brevundimonas aurantiaca TaxID=74316 RepID=UPI00391CFB49
MHDLSNDTPAIHRHRTAMVRHDLSQPMGLLVRHGLVQPGRTVFDYGCGQGDDLRILKSTGVPADGWDPHYRGDADKTPAEIVNLGFVLNVIERPAERLEALRAAWGLTRRVLSVATMVIGQGSVAGLRPLGDGYVTSRGTFQKYYAQAELQTLIQQTLGVAPVAVAPGIFFVFRQPEDEQDFLLERRAGRRRSAAAYRIPRPDRGAARSTRPPLAERIPNVLDELRDLALHRGRLPHPDEISSTAAEELARRSVSFTRALEACTEASLDPHALALAAQARREDLLVHYALGLLNRSTTTSRPSPAIVRDIRAQFGSHKEVSIQAMDYLKALSNEERVQDAAERAQAEGSGLLDTRNRLYVLGERAEILPGVLRCYIGCGVFLSGEPVGRYVLRIDPQRRRIVMWPLADANAPFPTTDLRIQIDLRRQDAFIRPDVRKLIRKGELEGLSPRTRQRKAELALRQTHPELEAAIFEKIEEAAQVPSRG